MKHYKQLNKIISRSKDDLYRAYDKGYQQAKEDFSGKSSAWIKANDDLPVPIEWVLVCERLDAKPRLAFIDGDGTWNTDVYSDHAYSAVFPDFVCKV